MRDLICLNQAPDTTTHHIWQTEGRTRWQSSHQSGKGRLPVIGGVEGSLAHWLPVKPKEGHAPHHPFDRLSWWRCYDLKLEPAFIIWADTTERTWLRMLQRLCGTVCQSGSAADNVKNSSSIFPLNLWVKLLRNLEHRGSDQEFDWLAV